jgi:hypothetical protein
MNKFLKTTDGYYFPAESVLALDATDANDVVVSVKGLAGTATSDLLTLDGGSAGVSAAIAEAVIEDINFGKQVVVSLKDVHEEVTAVAYADS